MSARKRDQSLDHAETRRRTYAGMVARLREFGDLEMDEETAVVDATLLLIRAFELTDPDNQRNIDVFWRALSGRRERDRAKRLAQRQAARR